MNDLTQGEVIAELYEEYDRHAAYGGLLYGVKRPTIFFGRKRAGGWCRKSTAEICMSWQAYQEHGWTETINVFRHELAHLVHANHSAEFKALAHWLGSTKLISKSAASPLDRPVRNHEYLCPNGHSTFSARPLKTDRAYSCSKCSAQYNPAYVLRPVEQPAGTPTRAELSRMKALLAKLQAA